MPDFINLTDPQNVGSGIGERLLLAPVSFFEDAGIMKPEQPYMYYGQKVVILESHIFKAGKGFLSFNLAPEQNSFTSSAIGDTGFKKFDQNARCYVAGSYADLHGTMAYLLNRPCIVLVEESTCGANLWYQVGTADVPAYLRANFNTGTTNNGNKGYEMILEATNEHVQIYAGAIDELDPDNQIPYLAAEDGTAITTEDGLLIYL